MLVLSVDQRIDRQHQHIPGEQHFPGFHDGFYSAIPSAMFNLELYAHVHVDASSLVFPYKNKTDVKQCIYMYTYKHMYVYTY